MNRKLIIEGGVSAFAGKPFGHPEADSAIKASVSEALLNGQWSLYDGELITQTQQTLASMWGLDHTLLCCSGTIAVELALRGCGVKPNDEVILSAYDFPGNFRAIEAIGARPVLVDVLERGWTMDPRQLQHAFTPQTSAVIVSHLHGETADIESIVDVSHRNNAKVVEDLCQSPGAKLNHQMLGTFGDVLTLSFGGSKLLSAGRGGAVLCGTETIFQRAKIFSNRGNDAFPFSQIQAAVLLPQLDQLASNNQKRLQTAKRIVEAIREIQWLETLDRSCFANHVFPAFYKVPIAIDLDAPFNRSQYLSVIQQERIPLGEAFRGFAKRSVRRCRRVGDLPHARIAAQQTMLLHHSVLMTEDEMIEALIETLGRAAEYCAKT